MKSIIVSFASGIIFAVGLSVSGMTNPDKVKGFLDIFGNWDISLAFVMIGAIGFNFFSFKKITKKKPLFSDSHFLPTKSDIDKRLILGASIFGIGWGLLGICPGPAIVNLVTLNTNAVLFVASMTIGMFIFKLIEKARVL
ncbi:YeeE/YedE family protein [Halobacteriovorax marinus]|uniref:DUF6691 family protein n=1 Tax=Halobacteriovorax marinus TaxID=97084 RepID=UPI000BC339EE|nr:DUF6691 family protein [Halobacteriovorax marinus]ATH06813.1 YeeE/YedE family protein [Halobacteriovorax marinus]